MDAYRGRVPAARVDAGAFGAGLEGIVGGCASEACCQIREARFVRGVLHGNVGGCGWIGVIVAGGGGA